MSTRIRFTAKKWPIRPMLRPIAQPESTIQSCAMLLWDNFLLNWLMFELSRKINTVKVGTHATWYFQINWEFRSSMFGSTVTHLCHAEVTGCMINTHLVFSGPWFWIFHEVLQTKVFSQFSPELSLHVFQTCHTWRFCPACRTRLITCGRDTMHECRPQSTPIRKRIAWHGSGGIRHSMSPFQTQPTTQYTRYHLRPF